MTSVGKCGNTENQSSDHNMQHMTRMLATTRSTMAKHAHATKSLTLTLTSVLIS